jgi:hypothetical protein
LRGEVDAAHHSTVISHARVSVLRVELTAMLLRLW